MPYRFEINAVILMTKPVAEVLEYHPTEVPDKVFPPVVQASSLLR